MTTKKHAKSCMISADEAELIMSVASMLKHARLSRRITQAQLAIKLGTRQQCISRIERIPVNLTLSTILKICKVLGYKPQISLKKS